MSEHNTEHPKMEKTEPVLDIQALIDSDLDGLLDAPQKPKKLTPQGRLEQAFLEIVEFRRNHGRLPDSQTREISERKLGSRLDGILANDEKLATLQPLDTEFGLLTLPKAPESIDDLLASADEMDLLGDDTGLMDLSSLPIAASRREADSVARRARAEDFERFEDLFKTKHAELSTGAATLAPYQGLRTVTEGRFFVLNGVMLMIAEVGEDTLTPNQDKFKLKQRLRIIFENGTESSMYRQSLSQRLFENDGLAVVQNGLGGDLELLDPNDLSSGYIYVLRSQSDDPQITGLGDLHKIGFTRGTVEQRIQNAQTSPTYLMAPVEVVSTYRTYNMKISALEHLLHRVFADVRLDLSQTAHDGRDYDPSEWFVVPYAVIDQAITMIMSGEIIDYVYDAHQRKLVRVC